MANPIISVRNLVLGEDDQFATFVIMLSAPSTSAVTVSYNTSNGTAANGTDYTAKSGTLTFAAGETVKTVQVPIIDASTAVPKGDFFFNLGSPVNAVIGNTQALATIIANNAVSGTPVMAISNPVVDATAGSVSFAVTLNKPSTGTVTVNYATAAGTDTANDFTPVTGTLTFAPGDTEKTVTVMLNQGTTAVPQESFNLVLSGVAGAALPNPVGTAVIGPSNQPTVLTPVISVANLTVGEGDGYAEFVVRLSAPSASIVTVSYSDSNGTAANGSDYIAVAGTLNFAAGETVKTVQVPIIDAGTALPKGDFVFSLGSPVNAVIGNNFALATIIANTAVSGTPVMAISNPVVDATAAVASFAVTLNKPSTGTVTVNYTTAAGTDTASDFTPVSGTLAFAPGDTEKTITVLLNQGATAVPEESFNLVLSGVAGATLPNAVGTATIGASNQPTVLTPVISVANLTVGEDDGYAEFVVRLNAPSASVVTVSYSDSNGTAANGSDYIAVAGTLKFAAGETVKTVQVPLIDASTAKPKGDFFFNLGSPVNAVIGNTQALATIIANNAVSGTPVMAISNPVVDATAPVATFAVTLNKPGTGTITVNYTTAAGSDTANDFTPVGGTLTFAPGDTEKTVTVQLTNGTTAVPEESFNLVLSGVVGATLPSAVGTATIGAANQPTVNTPVISVANLTVGEGDGYAEFVVRLNAPSASVVTVSYSDSNGTAANGSDYIAVAGTLNFAAGETVKTVQVPLIDAGTAVPKGDFFFNLGSPVNAVIGNTQALATIIANTAPSGTPVMSISNPVVDATAAVATFAVTLDKPSTGTVTVNYTTDPGSDTANDFVPVSGTLAFAPGDTEKTVTVLLTNPTTAEPEQSFNLVLSGVAGATLPNAVGTATIGAANQPAVITPVISAANVTVVESDGYAQLVVRLNAPSASVVTVSYSDSNGTAANGSDYIAVAGTLKFAAGETVKTVQVPIIEDGVTKSDGNFFFNLGSPVGATIALGSTQVTATIVDVICFLRGTRIGTPAGEVPVERLSVGDEVATINGLARRIVWIGEGRALAARGRRSTATPVIVRKGALADNVPHRDLHVTKGHSLYIDNVLIPVEFLVNHSSIVWDDHAQEVALYHIELETHDILVADGAPAESYRDDGNRWLFRNANTGWGLPPREPCAPVLTGGPVVDEVWRRLLERAGPRPRAPLTDDPDLHLLVDGRRVDASSRSDAIHVFRLAARPTAVRIVSRAGAPQELGLARDPRCLGVPLRQIMVAQGVRIRVANADDALLTEGFHEFEADNKIRWTDGDAAVPGPLFEGFNGPLELTLRLSGRTSYADGGAARRVA